MTIQKLGISGASGTGKTLLARHVSSKWGIDMLDLSTKHLWPKYKILSHKHLIGLAATKPHDYVAFAKETLKFREEKVMGAKDRAFVSDRTFLDLVVYTLIQVGPFISHEAMEEITQECFRCQREYTALFILEPLYYVEHDSRRIASMAYQRMVDGVFKYQAEFFAHGKFPIYRIPNMPIEERTMIISKFISHGQESISGYLL